MLIIDYCVFKTLSKFENKQHSTFNNQCSGNVPKEGIEPSHPKIHDFESCASTSSATLAWLRQNFDNRPFLREFRQSSSEEGCKYVQSLFFQQIGVQNPENAYNSNNFSRENACVGAENNTFTRPQTSLNNSEFLYASRSVALVQWLSVVNAKGLWMSRNNSR